eukprot:gene3852-5514_t
MPRKEAAFIPGADRAQPLQSPKQPRWRAVRAPQKNNHSLSEIAPCSVAA